jgi:hypothetical protein
MGIALKDGDSASKSAIGLSEFETHIAAANYYKMVRQEIQFERLDMCEGPALPQARNGRYGSVRAKVQKYSLSPVTVRTPPSLRRTSSVLGLTNFALPITSSAPEPLYLSR